MEESTVMVIFVQLVTAVATIAAVKSDVSWLKKISESHENRILRLEGKKIC
ncbi:hypothetical protein [Pseudoalteromonas xiamenensis]